MDRWLLIQSARDPTTGHGWRDVPLIFLLTAPNACRAFLNLGGSFNRFPIAELACYSGRDDREGWRNEGDGDARGSLVSLRRALFLAAV